MKTNHIPKIALLWRGNREARKKGNQEANRVRGVFEALAALNVAAEPAVYSEEMIEEVREQAVAGRRRPRLGGSNLGRP